MSESSTAILKRLGPSLTSDVISAMVAAGASPTAARQRVTRAQQDYTRLAGIRFTKNARFIYLPEQFGTHEYWAGLERAFYKAGKSYWNALVTLRSRGGVCPSYLFPTITSAPLLRKGQLSPDHLKERLSAIQLIKETDDETIGSYVEFVPHSFSKINTTKVQALLIAEHVALYGIREWARRLGFGSFGKFSIRGDEKPPIVAGMMWDLSAPSYFRPLLRVIEGKAKPGFIVCDINMNNVVSKDAVEAFVRKCDMASAPPSIPVLQLSIQPHRDARHHYEIGKRLRDLREQGVIIMASGNATHNLRAVFGQRYEETPAQVTRFNDWLHEAMIARDDAELMRWESAPDAAWNHPTNDHFLPLFTVLGATAGSAKTERIHHSFDYSVLSMDAYQL